MRCRRHGSDLVARAILGAGLALGLAAVCASAQDFVDPAEFAKPETGTFVMSLLSDRPSYHSKDNMVLMVISQEDCKLTVADIDSTGGGSILFPNKIQADNRLPAGKVLVLGDRASPIRLVAGDTESHTVVAQCVTAAGSLVRKTIKIEVK